MFSKPGSALCRDSLPAGRLRLRPVPGEFRKPATKLESSLSQALAICIVDDQKPRKPLEKASTEQLQATLGLLPGLDYSTALGP